MTQVLLLIMESNYTEMNSSDKSGTEPVVGQQVFKSFPSSSYPVSPRGLHLPEWIYIYTVLFS